MSVKTFWLLRDILEPNVLNHPVHTDIKKPDVLHNPVEAKNLNFNSYIYILYYQSNMPYNLTYTCSECYPFKTICFICKGGVATASRQSSSAQRYYDAL